VDDHLDFWRVNFAPLEKTPPSGSVRWTGKLSVPITGSYTFKLENSGTARLYVDRGLIAESINVNFWEEDPVSTISSTIHLKAGNVYDIEVEFIRPIGLQTPHFRLLFAYTPTPQEGDMIAQAAEVAARNDIALVFAGFPEDYESEGKDRPHMDLTGRQNELIEAVVKANKNTIVVLNCGSPVTMPWIDQISTLLLSYYPGQEGGHAVVGVLLGEINPSGKLTVTFPKRLADTPAFMNYPGSRQVIYGEGIFVGYRYYDYKNIDPLFPFGFGLSYTQFEYQELLAPQKAKIGDTINIQVAIKNSGARAGKETLQVYIHDSQSTHERPPQELKGFAKVNLEPGETVQVHLSLDARAFSYFDPDKNHWVEEPGEFEIRVGASSRDIRLSHKITID
jgi:beta-glucosidase